MNDRQWRKALADWQRKIRRAADDAARAELRRQAREATAEAGRPSYYVETYTVEAHWRRNPHWKGVSSRPRRSRRKPPRLRVLKGGAA